MTIFRIYNLMTKIIRPLFYLFFIYRFLKNKEERGKYSERKGFSSSKKPKGKIVWVHAASVGEALSSLPLIDKLKELSPKISILITTSTKTSKEIIVKKKIDDLIHQYVPWDNEKFCTNFLNFWQPDLAIFLESEIWPNLLNETNKKNIPLCLVNARITDNTFKKWFKFPKTIKYLLSFFSIIIAQDELSKIKLQKLGAKNIFVYGNLKNDSKKLLYDIEDFRKYDEYLREKNLLVAASTHEGEEVEIINKFKSLLIELPNLFLVLAPRHPDRRSDLVKIIKKSGFTDKDFILRSSNNYLDQNIKIFLLDSIGELGYFYKKSNAVIMGGAFGYFGGHNPIEPALFENAIFSGPNFYNFKDEYNQLLKNDGAKIIYDMDDLSILKNKEKLLSMAKNSKIFSENIKGTADKISVKLIGLLNENY
tara:strand:- start:1488 stop:2753 length:1266 start_codon:yes stop_codon:yes gene_type:complete